MPRGERDPNSVDLTKVFDLLKQIDDIADELHGAPPDPVSINNKDRMAAAARRSRRFMYAAHLAEKLKVEIDASFHKFRGTAD